MSHDIWVWLAAILTLCILSFLYKDNPFYKFAEYLLIGVSLGFIIALDWYNIIIPKIWIPLKHQHQYHLFIPVCLGSLYICRLFPKYAWLSRWPIAFALGAGIGMGLPLTLQAGIFKQIQSTMLSSYSISGIIAFIGVVATLIYFYFSAEHKGFVGGVARTGIWYVMISFGAIFGYTVMARMSLIIGRFEFLLHNWLGVIK
ncbi:MAG: hypothetical protein WC614_09455 [bacterium]